MKTAVLAVALGLSVLGNIVLLSRLRGGDEPRPAAPRTPERPAPPVQAAAPPAEVVVIRPEAPDPVPPPAPRTSTPAAPAIRHDPQVLGVIQAQDDFGAFWKELDRIFRARSKLDESLYARSIITAVQDFLRLPGSTFDQALRTGALQMAEARREHELARQALPPKEKNNPVYQQQKDVLDARHQERAASIVNGVKAHLNPADPRHAEFAGSLEKLLRNLAPRQ